MAQQYEQRRKKGRVIPFGYKVSDYDPKVLIPIPSELDCLRDALFYLNTCSHTQVARWLHAKTGRYISHVGLIKIQRKHKQAKHRFYNDNKAKRLKLRQIEEVDREHRRTIAEAKAKEDAKFISRGQSGGSAEAC